MQPKMLNLKPLNAVMLTLLAVGGINWGLTIMDYNVVTALADMTFSALEPTVYALVALSGLGVGVQLLGKIDDE